MGNVSITAGLEKMSVILHLPSMEWNSNCVVRINVSINFLYDTLDWKLDFRKLNRYFKCLAQNALAKMHYIKNNMDELLNYFPYKSFRVIQFYSINLSYAYLKVNNLESSIRNRNCLKNSYVFL